MSKRKPRPPTGNYDLANSPDGANVLLLSTLADGDEIIVNGEPFTARHEGRMVVLRPSASLPPPPPSGIEIGRVMLGKPKRRARRKRA